MANKLLENISYAVAAEQTYQDLGNKKVKAKPAFPYDPDSKSSPQTAYRWAQSPKHEPEIVFRANEPFSITILSRSSRKWRQSVPRHRRQLPCLRLTRGSTRRSDPPLRHLCWW